MYLTRLLLRAATAFTVITASMAAVIVTAGPARAYDSGDEAGFVGGINQLRASRGLGALSVNGQLTSVALSWAARMAANGSLSHNPNLGSQAPAGWTVIAENVGMGPNESTIQAQFTSSAPHYANMTNPQFSQVGVGVVPNNGALWVVEDFWGDGSDSSFRAPSPSSSPAPAPAPAPAPSRPPSSGPARPPAAARSAPRATSPGPAAGAAPPTPAVTTTTAPPAVDLDSAARQIQYFDTWG